MRYITTFEQMAAEKARAEVRKEGKKKYALEIAQKMLLENLPMETIIRITGLEKKDLQSLQQQSTIPQKEESRGGVPPLFPIGPSADDQNGVD